VSRVRIVLSPPDAPPLPVSPAPFDQSRRWRSAYEDADCRETPLIFMAQSAYREVVAHAASDVDREVGGMLVGQARQTPEGDLYVLVEAQLAADHVRHGPAHLTFTSDALTDLLDRREQMHPDQQVVGWYHTHPGLSVFLSHMDMWLHTYFFPEPWQVALVIDPVASRGGFFRRSSRLSGGLEPRRFVGFYEWGKPGAASVVAWNNLSAKDATP
jgi:proteasome lid subunit RPN8/RPN11